MLRSCRLCRQFSRPSLRLYHSSPFPSLPEPDSKEDIDLVRRRRKSEWKRQQRGQNFLDYTVVTIRAGKGGDGCAAFHREKWKPFGPPSGGNGGRGGDVYIKPIKGLTTLGGVAKRIVAEAGTNGQGAWQNGRAGAPFIIHVPLGTIVRELARDDPRRAKDEWESEEESLQALDVETKQDKMRANRWVHYPGAGDNNISRDSFLAAEKAGYDLERQRKLERFIRTVNDPIALDLHQEMDSRLTEDSPLGARNRPSLGHLVASGGAGGLGNPHFLTGDNRSPKFATRGQPGERITLSLELKLLADIGLVGFPNAGKSTLLRALTGGRVNAEVAGYAFTTLNPTVGVVRVGKDGSYEGSIRHGAVYGETQSEDLERLARLGQGDFAYSPTRNEIVEDPGEDVDSNRSIAAAGHRFDVHESFRFTVADNPGLIENASENAGLGHSFLRSIERSLALVYVVDLSGPSPWDELSILRNELEAYSPGMSRRARLVIANKADLLAGDGTPEEIDAAKNKLRLLEEFVSTKFCPGEDFQETEGSSAIEVVPVSAKYSQNMEKAVHLMKGYVEKARDESLDKSIITDEAK